MRPRPARSPALLGSSRDGGHRGRPSRRRRLAVALVGWLAVPLVWAAPAMAGVGLGLTPEFPQTVTVGDAGVAASLRIENVAFGGEGQDTATLNDITLVPSCGLSPAAPPDVKCTGAEDPGAFQLSASGTGQAGTACAGRTFTITETDPTSGSHTFTADQDVVLGAPGTATDTCDINFTFEVVRLPAGDAFP
ncbi:MAG TPA: hypothetical protein VGR26_16460, partial [Acidimicrobiales bacterium]|nr:hypothetical protein [Acidimicrobiales bacterium]